MVIVNHQPLTRKAYAWAAGWRWARAGGYYQVLLMLISAAVYPPRGWGFDPAPES